MNVLDEVLSCLPAMIQTQILSLDKPTQEKIEEIRLYAGKSTQIIANKQRKTLNGIVTASDLNTILNHLMQYSYYAYEEDLAKGFVTITGGHRVGICGKVVLEKGSPTIIREISSMNIRCAREVIGCSDKIMPYLFHDRESTDKLNNVLLISPPGCGKTTLLRDVARNLSQRYLRVSICDERSEIAAMTGGVSSYQFGPMVDVLDGCPKAAGMMMLIRSMSPQVILTDEIGKREDLDAIESCVHCGVHLITTIHGYDMEDLKQSEIYPAIQAKAFQTLIFLTDKPTVGTVKEVIHV